MAGYNLSRAAWRTSSYSGQNGACVEVAALGDGIAWRRSTYSGANGDSVEVIVLGAGVSWHTSSHSGTNGDCVEVACDLPGVVAVRDSKDRVGPAVIFTPAAWREFTAEVRSGGFEIA